MVYPHLNFEDLANNEDDKVFLQNVPKINIDFYQKNYDGAQISNYCLNSDATLEYQKLKKFKQQDTDLTSSNSENDQSDNVSIFQRMSNQSINIKKSQLDQSFTVNHISEQIKNAQNNTGQHQDQQQYFASDQLIPSEKKISVLSNKFSSTQIPNQEEIFSHNQAIESGQDYTMFNCVNNSHQIINQENQRIQGQQQRKVSRNKQEKQKTYFSKNHNPSDIKIQSRNSLTKSCKDIEVLRSVTSESENKVFQNTAIQNIIEFIRTSFCGDIQKGNQAQTSTQSINKRISNVRNNEFNYHRTSKSQSIKKSNTRDSTLRNNKIPQCLLFGKCGIDFEKYKEYQNYYPKQNFSAVIKTYKKLQQQARLKRNRANTSLNQILAGHNVHNRNRISTCLYKKQGNPKANPS